MRTGTDYKSMIEIQACELQVTDSTWSAQYAVAVWLKSMVDQLAMSGQEWDKL